MTLFKPNLTTLSKAESTELNETTIPYNLLKFLAPYLLKQRFGRDNLYMQSWS